MSNYDEYLRQLKLDHSATAKSAIKVLFELLKQEDSHLSREDMYDRIMKDLLPIWARDTIVRNMPEDLKDPERRESGKKGQKKQMEMVVTNDGNVADAMPANPSRKKENSQIGSAQRYETNGQRKKQTQVSEDETLSDDINDDAHTAGTQTQPSELTPEERIKQLEEALKQANLFNKASEMPKAQTNEVILPERLLSAMFMTLRNGEKKCIYCTVEGNEITRIEGNAMRVRREGNNKKVPPAK